MVVPMGAESVPWSALMPYTVLLMSSSVLWKKWTVSSAQGVRYAAKRFHCARRLFAVNWLARSPPLFPPTPSATKSSAHPLDGSVNVPKLSSLWSRRNPGWESEAMQEVSAGKSSMTCVLDGESSIVPSCLRVDMSVLRFLGLYSGKKYRF